MNYSRTRPSVVAGKLAARYLIHRMITEAVGRGEFQLPGMDRDEINQAEREAVFVAEKARRRLCVRSRQLCGVGPIVIGGPRA